MIEEEDVGFYPVNSSLCLDADEEEQDPFQVDTTASIDGHFRELATARKQLMSMKSENSTLQFAATDFNKRVLTRFDNLAKQRDSIIAELSSAIMESRCFAKLSNLVSTRLLKSVAANCSVEFSLFILISCLRAVASSRK